MEREFWCVTTTIYDKGRATAAITRSVEADICPESTFTSTSRRDIYNDWFEDLREAERYVEDVKRA